MLYRRPIMNILRTKTASAALGMMFILGSVLVAHAQDASAQGAAPAAKGPDTTTQAIENPAAWARLRSRRSGRFILWTSTMSAGPPGIPAPAATSTSSILWAPSSVSCGVLASYPFATPSATSRREALVLTPSAAREASPVVAAWVRSAGLPAAVLQVVPVAALWVDLSSALWAISRGSPTPQPWTSPSLSPRAVRWC